VSHSLYGIVGINGLNVVYILVVEVPTRGDPIDSRRPAQAGVKNGYSLKVFIYPYWLV